MNFKATIRHCITTQKKLLTNNFDVYCIMILQI